MKLLFGFGRYSFMLSLQSPSESGQVANYSSYTLMNNVTIPPVPKKPSGVYFKVRTNLPETARIGLDLGYGDITFPYPGTTDQYIIVVDENTGTYLPTPGIPANFSGYVFVSNNFPNFSTGLQTDKISKIELILSQATGDWSGSYIIVDNVGFWSKRDANAPTDFAELAKSLNEAYPPNVNDVFYQIVQDFEEEWHAEQFKPAPYGAALSTHKLTVNALAGMQSGLIKYNSPNPSDWNYDYLVKDVDADEGFKPALETVNGIVMRVTSNLPAGVGFNATIREPEPPDGISAPDYLMLGGELTVGVSADFSQIYIGNHNIPANFDGYVFLVNDNGSGGLV